MKATVFSIQRNSLVDGPGIRTTVFFKGCNLKCKWCHNPESQSPKKEILFYKNKCNGCGRCRGLTAEDENFICFSGAKEICGKEYTCDELLTEIIKDKAFYDTSNGGVTFSGGECMLQIDFLEEILKECKKNGIHTAVDTAKPDGFPACAVQEVDEVFIYLACKYHLHDIYRFLVGHAQTFDKLRFFADFL